jgi:hypothetical protein
MSEYFSTPHDVENIYTEIKNIYNSDSNKEQNKYIILKILNDCFEKIKISLQSNETSSNLFNLKILMETQFIRDVKCQYNYLFTPDKCGCDLRELVFNFETETNRTNLLNNIKTLSETLTNNHGTIPHIITDIDDTIFPNNNGFIETAGSDTSWHSHKLYPGIKQFYEEFYKTLPLLETRYTTVLSGTPVFLKNIRINNQKIQTALGSNFGFLQGFDSKRHVLYGLIKGNPYKLAVSSSLLAEIKFNKYAQYKLLFPEYKMLLIGDNGQGDLLAGLRVLEHDTTALLFIHNIFKYKTHYMFSTTDEQKYKHERLYFFKNYLELASIFLKLDLFKFTNVKKIRTAIKNDLEISYISDKSQHLYNHFSTKIIPYHLRISNRLTRKFRKH